MASKLTGFDSFPVYGLLPSFLRRDIVQIDPTKAASNEKEIKAEVDYLIEYFDSFQQQTNKNDEGKPMFNQFKNESLKMVKVNRFIFELIVKHNLRAVHESKKVTEIIEEDELFAIGCDDAILFAIRTGTYSSVDNEANVITFEIKEINPTQSA